MKAESIIFNRSQISQLSEVFLNLCVDCQQLLSDLLYLIGNMLTVDLIMALLLFDLRLDSCTLSMASSTSCLFLSKGLCECINSLCNSLLVVAEKCSNLMITM